MKSSWLPAAVLSILLAAPAAAGVNFFPLVQGMQWRYATPDGSATLHRAVTGTLEILGRSTVEIDVVETGPLAQHTREYWSHDDPAGPYLLHAVWNESGGLTYDPPLPALPSPDQMTPGHTWEGTCVVHSGWPPDTTTPGDTLHYYFSVGEPDTLTVPAGTFVSYNIARSWSLRGPGSGTSRELLEKTFRPEWYADGVGLVQLGMFELLSVPVPDATTTWSEVKNRYR